MSGPKKVEGFLNPQEAADKLGISYSAVYRGLREGRIKYNITPGGRRRIPESEIERLLHLRGGTNIPDRD